MQRINLENNDYCLINENKLNFRNGYALIEATTKKGYQINGLINEQYEDCFKNNKYAKYLALNHLNRKIIPVLDNDYLILINNYDSELDMYEKAVHLRIIKNKVQLVIDNLPGLISLNENFSLLKTPNFLYDLKSGEILGTYHEFIDVFKPYRNYLNQEILAAWVKDKIEISQDEIIHIGYFIGINGQIVSNQIYLQEYNKILNINLEHFNLGDFLNSLKSNKVKQLKKEVKPS